MVVIRPSTTQIQGLLQDRGVIFVELADGSFGLVDRRVRGNRVRFVGFQEEFDRDVKISQIKQVFVSREQAEKTAEQKIAELEAEAQASLLPATFEEQPPVPATFLRPADKFKLIEQKIERGELAGFTPIEGGIGGAPIPEFRTPAQTRQLQIQREIQREELIERKAEEKFEQLTPLEKFSVFVSGAFQKPEKALGATLFGIAGQREPARELGREFTRETIEAQLRREPPADIIARRTAVGAAQAVTLAVGGFGIGLASRTALGTKLFGLKAVQVGIKAGVAGIGGFLGVRAIEKPTPQRVGEAAFFPIGLGVVKKGIKFGERVGFAKLEVPRETRKLLGTKFVARETGELVRIGRKEVEAGELISRKFFEIPKKRVVTPPSKVKFAERQFQLTGQRVVKRVGELKGTVFGSFAQAVQVRGARKPVDVDVFFKGFKQKQIAAKELAKIPRTSLPRQRKKAFKLDIKEEQKLKSFLFFEKGIEIESGKFITLREQFARKAAGFLTPERRARKGLKDLGDALDIIKSEATIKKAAGQKLSSLERKALKVKFAKPKVVRKPKVTRRPKSLEESLAETSRFRQRGSSVFGIRPSKPSVLPSRIRPPSALAKPSTIPSVIGKPVVSKLPPPSRITPTRPSRLAFSVLGRPSRIPPVGRPSVLAGRPSQIPKVSRILQPTTTTPPPPDFDIIPKKRKRKLPKQPFKFTPSILAGQLGVDAPKQPKTITGFGIRPRVGGRRLREVLGVR